MEMNKRYIMRNGFLLLFSVLMVVTAVSQLKVGDSFPNLSFQLLDTSRTSLLALPETIKKPMIMQIWNTNCDGSLEVFQRMERLYDVFQDEINLVVITEESSSKVNSFFKKHKYETPLLPVITDGKEILNLLPRKGMPYSIWIDKNRLIQYISPSYNNTEKHLKAFLNNEPLSIRNAAIKKRKTHLWEMDSGRFLSHIAFYSAFARCDDQYEVVKADFLSRKGIASLSYNCYTLPDLIRIAVEEGGRVNTRNAYSLEIKIKDSLKLKKPADQNLWDAWRDKYLYSYSLLAPADHKNMLYQFMQEDLQRYFGLEIGRCDREVMGYSLELIPGKKLVISKSAKSWDAYNQGDITKADVFKFKKQPLSRLMFLLETWFGYNQPIMKGEIGECMIDFDFRKSSVYPPDIGRVNEDLKKINLYLKPVFVLKEVIVVSEK